MRAQALLLGFLRSFYYFKCLILNKVKAAPRAASFVFFVFRFSFYSAQAVPQLFIIHYSLFILFVTLRLKGDKEYIASSEIVVERGFAVGKIAKIPALIKYKSAVSCVKAPDFAKLDVGQLQHRGFSFAAN